MQNILINHYNPSIYFSHFQGFSSLRYYEYSAISNYNSLQVNFRHTTGHGLTFQAAYTYSHSLDTTTGYTGNHGVDDMNLSRWYATSDTNRPHVLILNYVYDLPFFKNSSRSFLKNGLGGWKISGISIFYSGVPVDFGCGHSGFSTGIGRGIQCNTLGPLKSQKGVDNDPQFGPTPTWFNPGLIAQPLESQLRADGQSGMFGYMGRNVLTGPGRNNFDLALLKDFQAPWFKGEHSTVQFRLESFNTFNHPQWDSINAGCGSETPFGSPCSGNENNYQNGQVASARSPRLVQLGMKFIF